MSTKKLFRAIMALVVAFAAVQSNAQWMPQTIDLEQGWNAVHLKVQPVSNACDAVSADVPVEQVQFWAETAGHIAFEVDPKSPLERQLRWYSWRPASSNGAELNGFSRLFAGRAYLIQASSASTLSITGRAVLTRNNWVPNSWNLVGVPVAEFGGCSFYDYFDGTPEIGGYTPGTSYIGEVGTNSAAKSVYNAHMPIESGKAYWIKTKQITEYDGPVHVSLASGASYVRFGSLPKPETLQIVNDSAELRTLTVSTNSLGLPPEGEAYAPYIPLSWKPVGSFGAYTALFTVLKPA